MRVTLLLCLPLLISCRDAAKEKELAELRAKVAQMEQAKPSLSASSAPLPSLARGGLSPTSPTTPKPCLDLAALAHEGIGIDTTPQRLTAWCAAFAPGLSVTQRDRAALALLRYLHRSYNAIQYNLNVKFINERGHFNDLDNALVALSRKIKKASQYNFMTFASTADGPGSEAAYAVLNYDESAVAGILAGGAVPVRPTGPDSRLIESWVSLKEPADYARYKAWSEEIASGYSEDQADHIRRAFIISTLARPAGIYWSNRKLQIFDKNGHVADLAAIVQANKHEVNGQKSRLMIPENLGPELGAAVFNFDQARYLSRVDAYMKSPTLAGEMAATTK